MPAPSSLLVAAQPSGAVTIFLSSTIGDYEALRRKVQEVLLRKAECACFLSEDWVGGYDATVEKCQQRVLGSSGFILLLGYWYGSIPPGRDKSITHLEFDWAFDKWKGDPFPKMAVLKPKPGSAADKDLRALADNLIPQTQQERDQHAERLTGFHAQVDDKRGEWRTIRTFEDEQDLREHALVIGRDWRGYTPLAAARGQVMPDVPYVESQLREEQLGALGRESQHSTIKKILAGIAAYPEAPAVAMVVHGDEDEGQRAFVAHAVATLLKQYHPKRPIGRLPPGSETIAALVAWLAQRLGMDKTAGIETPQQLAERVAQELKHQPLYFVIDRIGDLKGGIPAFQRDFWQPFWARLRELRNEQRIVNRLVAIVADYTGDSAKWGDVVTKHEPGVQTDHMKIILVPRLQPIEREHLFDWFDYLDVPDAPAGRLNEIAGRVLKNERGEYDGTPQRVFDRLRSESLWPEGDF